MASAGRRVAFYKRVLALICCCVICLGMVEPPKAKAIAVADDIATVAALFVAATGCTWAVTKMDKSSFTSVVGDQLQKYCTAKNLGTVAEFASDMIFGHATGKVLLNKAAAEKLAAFTKWLLGEKGITAGSKPVPIVVGSNYVLLADGSKFNVGYFNVDAWNVESIGSAIKQGTNISFKSGTSITWSDKEASFRNSSGVAIDSGPAYRSDSDLALCYYNKNSSVYFGFQWIDPKTHDSVAVKLLDRSLSDLGDLYTSGSLAVSAEGIQEIHYPATDTITKDKSLAIAVPGIAADTLDGELGAILDAILAGKLAVPTTDVIDGSAAAEPGAGEVTDVDDLNLPSIATVITQKFPFSIPWDVVRGIKLLAAPPEAPKWSVNFMKPLQHRVKLQGDTTVTLDMADYPLVGEVCRWCFTVGFCILLAAGTKKLSWIGG